MNTPLKNYQFGLLLQVVAKNYKTALRLETGLGKTLLALYIIDNFKKDYSDIPIIITTPNKQVVQTWKNEIIKHGFNHPYTIIEKKVDLKNLTGGVNLLTYHTLNCLVEDRRLFNQYKHSFLIIDEFHSFKSDSSIRYNSLLAFDRTFFYFFTASAIHLRDAKDIIFMNLLLLGRKFSKEEVKNITNNSLQVESKGDFKGIPAFNGKSINTFRKILKDNWLYKEDDASLKPEVNYHLLELNDDDKYQELYHRLANKYNKQIDIYNDEALELGNNNTTNDLHNNPLSILNSRYRGSDYKRDSKFKIEDENEFIVYNDARFNAVIELIEEKQLKKGIIAFKNIPNKITMSRFLNSYSIPNILIDKVKDIEEHFKTNDCFILANITQLKSMNLAYSDTLIFFYGSSVPSEEEQAIGRIYRLTSPYKAINIYKFKAIPDVIANSRRLKRIELCNEILKPITADDDINDVLTKLSKKKKTKKEVAEEINKLHYKWFVQKDYFDNENLYLIKFNKIKPNRVNLNYYNLLCKMSFLFDTKTLNKLTRDKYDRVKSVHKIKALSIKKSFKEAGTYDSILTMTRQRKVLLKQGVDENLINQEKVVLADLKFLNGKYGVFFIINKIKTIL